MPCETGQTCILAPPDQCGESPCREIPTCVGKLPDRDLPFSPFMPLIISLSDIFIIAVKTESPDKSEGSSGNVKNPGDGKSNDIESGEHTQENPSCEDIECTPCNSTDVFVYDTRGCKTCNCYKNECQVSAVITIILCCCSYSEIIKKQNNGID